MTAWSAPVKIVITPEFVLAIVLLLQALGRL
jgi:hypothetical protein